MMNVAYVVVVKGEEDREVQRDIFGQFADLARELDLPLNVHSRSAGRHAVSLLLERGARRVQLHAFDGKLSSALPAVEAGYFFSVPPSVVRSRLSESTKEDFADPVHPRNFSGS